MAKKLIGVDLGGTTIKFAILTENGEIQQKWSLRTNILDDGSHIVPDIINSINHHLDLYKMSRDQFIGIGMVTPGTIDREKGTVIGAYNLNWKTTQNVKEEIEQWKYEIIDNINSTFKSLSDIDILIVTGGGSEIIDKDIFVDAFPQIKVKFVDDAEVANAKGFYYKGKALELKSK